jgi:hypothetical protein
MESNQSEITNNGATTTQQPDVLDAAIENAIAEIDNLAGVEPQSERRGKGRA